jgi:hypothetical protein
MIYFSNLEGGPITIKWFLSDGRIYDQSGYHLEYFIENHRYKIIPYLPDVDPDLIMDEGL